MTDTHTPDITHAMNVRADMNITKDDLVAIRIAEVERALHDEKLALVARRRNAETELTKCRVQLEKTKPVIAMETIGEHFDAALVVLNNLRSRKDPFVCHCWLEQDKTGKYVAHGTIEGVDGVAIERGVKPAKAKILKDIEGDILAHGKEISDCENGMLEVKRKLQDIPMLERQAKAAVARAVMSSSDDGGTLLDIVSRTTLPGLPAPKG